MGKVLKCRFCGYEGPAADFEMDQVNNGFWCEFCDKYSYVNSKSCSKHSFTMILEEKKSKLRINAKKTSIKLNKQLSPLRYPGGKSKIADYICNIVKPANTDIFIEPFAGGATDCSAQSKDWQVL